MKRKIGLVIAIAGVGLLVSAANATVIGWDFSADPDTQSPGMTKVGNGYGQGAGLLGNGTAEFADTTTDQNNAFWYGNLLGGFTFDIQVKVLESVTDVGGKSISFREASQLGRGIQFDTNQMEIVSNGNIRTYAIDFTQYQIVRLSLPNDGYLYPYLWNAGDSTWIDLGAQAVTGQTGAAGFTGGGVAIGSWSQSTTTTGRFQVDNAYFDTEVARGGTGVPLWVPEPATLALLGLSGLPMLWRRRR